MPGKTITLRQYLYFGCLERGYSGEKAEKFIERYAEAHPHANLNDRMTQDRWEARRKAGTLP